MSRRPAAPLPGAIAFEARKPDALTEQIAAIARAEVDRRLAELGVGAPAPTLVTIAAYARDRSISVSTVRAAIGDGRLEAQRIGRAVRVRRDAEIARPVRAKVDRTASAARRLGLR